MASIKELVQRLGLAGIITFGGGTVVGIAGKSIYDNLQTGNTPVVRAAEGFVPEPTATLTPTPTEIPVVVEKGGVKMIGIPDQAINVELARGDFQSTIGQGMEAFTAEPGWLLVGPDFESQSRHNPLGDNFGGWLTMWNARGQIRPLSPDTQHSFVNDPPSTYLASEGGWAVFSGPRLTFEVGGIRVEVPAENGLNNIVVIRGLYPDGQQDTPRNSGVRLLDYEPGATLGMRHPGGTEGENSAFWSEGQFRQIVATSHRSDSNCGLEGCSRLRVLYLDLNTRAVGIWEQTAGRSANLAEATRNAVQDWTVRYRNY